MANPLARKKGLYMKSSAFADLIPISIVMKAPMNFSNLCTFSEPVPETAVC